MNNDTEFYESPITDVKGDSEHGWEIAREDGWRFFVSKDSPVVPVIGMTARFYGRGLGSPVRGLVINGQTVFYRTVEEDAEHHQIQMYGKDAADWLQRWDAGTSVWSIEMGGMGPGYEQCIHITCAEILRELLRRKPDFDATTDDEWRKLSDEIHKTMFTDGSVLKQLGLSGTQYGAGLSLAVQLYRQGPRAIMNDEEVKDRHIRVNRRFPTIADPIDMLIFCPNCGKQHIDRPDPICGTSGYHEHPDAYCRLCKGHEGACDNDPESPNAAWTNPVHRSHTCRTEDGGCGTIWRPADVPTNGVAAIKTTGSGDTWNPSSTSQVEINRQALDLAETLLERMATLQADNALHAIADLKSELAEHLKLRDLYTSLPFLLWFFILLSLSRLLFLVFRPILQNNVRDFVEDFWNIFFLHTVSSL